MFFSRCIVTKITMGVCIFIPVYNEQKTIRKVIENVFNAFKDSTFEILVVDDGSTDSTYKILQQLEGIKVIRNSKNTGKGNALKIALENTNMEVFAIQDADLEYNPAELKMLVHHLIEKNLDCVFGSRFLKPNPNIYPHYLLGNRLVTAFINLLENSNRVTDAYTCYKVFRTEILKKMNLHSSGFEIEAELTMKMKMQGVRFNELPISYTPRSFSEGKKIKFVDGIRAVFTAYACRIKKI